MNGTFTIETCPGFCNTSSSEEDLRTPMKATPAQHCREMLNEDSGLTFSCEQLSKYMLTPVRPSISSSSRHSVDFNRTSFSIDEHRREDDNYNNLNATVACTLTNRSTFFTLTETPLRNPSRRSVFSSSFRTKSGAALTSLKTHLTPKRPIPLRFKKPADKLSAGSNSACSFDWETSLDVLLADPEGRTCFRLFLESEYSDENLLFWEEVQLLKQLTGKSKIKQKVKEIYLKFVIDDAPKMLNLTMPVRFNVASKVIKNPSDKNCFEEAENSIFKLMNADSFRRFKATMVVLWRNQTTRHRQLNLNCALFIRVISSIVFYF